MKKTMIFLLLIALLLPAALSAQEAGNTDNRIFGIQTGFVGGYDLLNGISVAGRDFGIFFTLNGSMQAGLRVMESVLSTGTAVMFDFGYFFTPQIGIDVMVGSDTASIVGAMDAAFTIFRSGDDSPFSSNLKIKAGYIFDQGSGIENGVINAGLVGTIGY
jgi:hypothetical protein